MFGVAMGKKMRSLQAERMSPFVAVLMSARGTGWRADEGFRGVGLNGVAPGVPAGVDWDWGVGFSAILGSGEAAAEDDDIIPN